jgi:glycolate oxidase iron-sulfur subunit
MFLPSTSETIPPIKFLSYYLPDHFKEEVKKCTRCGLCISECPLYNKKRDDFFSPRNFILSLAEFTTKSKNHIQELVNYCITNCDTKNPPCENACPTGVSFSKIFVRFNNRGGRNDK